MKVLSGEFVTSVAAGGALPAETHAVVALVGRSNVGKSTLVNTLARQRIARAGATPGTTRLLNVYRLRISTASRGSIGISLIDLPGYGYARGTRQAGQGFEALTTEFFTSMLRSAPAARGGGPWLAGAVLVVDARHPGLPADKSAHAWLAARACPVVVVATKGDRLSRSACRRSVSDHEAALECPVLSVSRRADGDGADRLWRQLAELAAGDAA